MVVVVVVVVVVVAVVSVEASAEDESKFYCDIAFTKAQVLASNTFLHAIRAPGDFSGLSIRPLPLCDILVLYCTILE